MPPGWLQERVQSRGKVKSRFGAVPPYMKRSHTCLGDGVFKDAETKAIVNFVIAIAKYVAEEGVKFWDENGELIANVPTK